MALFFFTALGFAGCGEDQSEPSSTSTVSVQTAGHYVLLVGEPLEPPTGRCLGLVDVGPVVLVWPPNARLSIVRGKPVVQVGDRRFHIGQDVDGDDVPLRARRVRDLPNADDVPQECWDARVTRIDRPTIP